MKLLWSNEIIYESFEVFKNFIIFNLNILILICKYFDLMIEKNVSN